MSKYDTLKKYFGQQEGISNQLLEAVADCTLGSLGIRFHFWRVCLGLIPANNLQPKQQIDEQRKTYWDLANKQQQLITNTPATAMKAGNPLALLAKPKASNSAQQQTLKNQIAKDISKLEVGTAPTFDKKILGKVLYVWCSSHPELEYDTGLVQILDVIASEYYACLQSDKSHQNDSWLYLHNHQNFEADIFTVFSALLNCHQIEFYQKNKDNKQRQNNITARLTKLLDNELRALDIDLYRHLKLKDVNIKLVLMRWLRRLVVAEFGKAQTCCIWDNVLCKHFKEDSKQVKSSYGLKFFDCICIAMLVYPRDLVLNKQSSYEIGQLYTKYPPLKGQFLQELINLAYMLQHLILEEKATAAILKHEDKKKELFLIDKKYMTMTDDYPEDVSNQQQQEVQMMAAEQKTNLAIPVKTDQKKETTQLIVQKGMQVKTPNSDFPIPSVVHQQAEHNPLRLTTNKSQTNQNPLSVKAKTESQVKLVKQTPKPPIQPPAQQAKESAAKVDVIVPINIWTEIQSLLQRSIAQNTDIESKSLCMKAMKLFQACKNSSQQKTNDT